MLASGEGEDEGKEYGLNGGQVYIVGLWLMQQ